MKPRRTSSGSTSAALPTTPIDRAFARFASRAASRSASSSDGGDARRGSASRRGGARAPDRPRRRGTRRRSSSPRAAARRPCRRGRRVSTSRPARSSRCRSAARRPPRTSRTCPAGSPACRCRSTSPRSSGRTSSGPSRSSSRKCSQVAHLGTRFELAISTRGASACVRKHADRLAALDEQRLVVAERAERRDDALEARPVARGLAACRRRRPAPPAARPPRGRGCSAASGARLPAPSPCKRAHRRGQREWHEPCAFYVTIARLVGWKTGAAT